MGGSGLGSWLKSAWNWLKGNKVLSRAAKAGAPLAGEFAPVVSGLGTIAGALGLGRRRRRQYGGALRLAGMGVNPAGMGRTGYYMTQKKRMLL